MVEFVFFYGLYQRLFTQMRESRPLNVVESCVLVFLLLQYADMVRKRNRKEFAQREAI